MVWQARRWNGLFPDNVDDRTWRSYLLRRMQGVPLAKRTARYVAAWAVITPDGQEYVRRFCRSFRFGTGPLRPMTPGAPMSSLEIYAEGQPSPQEQIAAEWARWGILKTISASDQAAYDTA